MKKSKPTLKFSEEELAALEHMRSEEARHKEIAPQRHEESLLADAQIEQMRKNITEQRELRRAK